MKWRKWLGAWICVSCCLGLVGCQPTPTENAVVSKGEGLNPEVISEPMGEGEIRETDIPEHWQTKELKNKDRMLFQVDLELEKTDIQNLPVMEMKNKRLSEDELKKLVNYFAGEEECYQPQPYTKETYEQVISRIEKKEGFYAAFYYWMDQRKIKASAEMGKESAPEKEAAPEKAELKFQKRFVDEAYEKTIKNKYTEIDDLYENREKEIWFEADVGENREAHIQAETYKKEAGNSSSFSWMEGGEIISPLDLESRRMFFEYQQENAFTDQVLDKLSQFESQFENQSFEASDGEIQAKKILEDLEIKDMSVEAQEPILWFSKESYPKGEVMIGETHDLFWLVNPEEAEYGYRYTYSRAIGGLHELEGDSAVVEQTEEMYAPPFPVETISVTVTESGVKEFTWTGMSEQVQIIAENTKLLPFSRIEERLKEQILYWYSSQTQSQPENDTTQFKYEVREAELGYTYITAYGNPDHAWLVPAWRFLVVEGQEEASLQFLPFTIEALEGRTIVGA